MYPELTSALSIEHADRDASYGYKWRKDERFPNLVYGRYSIKSEPPVVFPTVIPVFSEDQMPITEGRYYYEIKIERMGGFGAQIGWADSKFKCEEYQLGDETATGVGDDDHSWAIDGHRKKYWHNEEDTDWGQALAQEPWVVKFLDPRQREEPHENYPSVIRWANSGVH
jgi:hypothetical protein